MDPLTRQIRNEQRKHDYVSVQYGDLVESMGVHIIEEKNFGDYQGDIVYHVARNGPNGAEYGILIQGYGSCSGCDALQAAEPSYWQLEDGHAITDEDLKDVLALRDQMAASVMWQGTEAFQKLLDETKSEGDWWHYEPELADYVRGLAELIEATAVV